jgi:predicted CXXCH cytochrome family protein
MFDKFSHRELPVDRKFLSVLLVAILLVYLSGCSSTHNYKVLSFFFDGVPNQVSETTVQSVDTLHQKDTVALALNLSNGTKSKIQFHSPYQDKQCSSCHDQGRMGKLNKSQPDLCYDCHEDFSKKFKVLHGPAGGGQCTMCHNPHSSVNENLLNRTGQALCLYCHDQAQVMKTDAHLENKELNCTECHNPHGGNDRYSLR